MLMLLLTCNRENGSPCWEGLKYDLNFGCLSSALMPALFSLQLFSGLVDPTAITTLWRQVS